MPLGHGTPVFIISYNRGDMLRRCVDGVRRQSAVSDIIVHDNGSDDPTTLQALEDLAAQDVLVVRRPKIQHVGELDAVAETVSGFLGDRPREFIVTDGDIDLSGAHPDAVAVYSWLLQRYPDAECVGPMLTIADIPETYPLRGRAIQGHIEQFWHNLPDVDDSPFGLVASIAAPIDTTFAVHRASARFRRLLPGRRVYAPFEARHLDWYIDRDSFHDQGAAADRISHWASEDWHNQEAHVGTGVAPYYTVARTSPLELSIRKRYATDPPADISGTGAQSAAEVQRDEATVRMEREFSSRMALAQAAEQEARERADECSASLRSHRAWLARSRKRTRRLAVLNALLIAAAAVLLVGILVGFWG